MRNADFGRNVMISAKYIVIDPTASQCIEYWVLDTGCDMCRRMWYCANIAYRTLISQGLIFTISLSDKVTKYHLTSGMHYSNNKLEIGMRGL